MKLTFFRQPASKNKLSTRMTVDLVAMRAKILSWNLLGLLVVTLGLFSVSLPGIIEQKSWGILLVFSILILWMAAVAFIPTIKYSFKAGSYIFVGLSLGLLCLVTNGLFGSGLLILLVIPLIVGLFYSTQRSFLVFLIAVIAIVTTILLLDSGVLTTPSWTLSLDQPILFTWLVSGFSLALLGSVSLLSLLSVSHELEASVLNETRSVETFEVERAKQEHRILQSTQEQERRLRQFRSALDVAFAMGRDHKVDQLLQKIADLIRERFNYYYVGVYLLDEQKAYAVLKAGTGEPGAAMLEAGHRLAVNDASAVGWAIQHQQARVAVDVGFDAVHFNNPLLSLTRTELALPLLIDKDEHLSVGGDFSLDHVGFKVLGAVTIQSSEAKAFSQDDVLILQEVAGALAAALRIMLLIRQLEMKLDESQKLNRQYLQEAWKEVARESENNEFSYESKQYFSNDSSQQAASSEFSFPVKLRDQEIGQLILELDSPALKDEEKTFIEAVTNQAAVALENVRLIEKNQRQAGYERLLSDISHRVSSSTDLDTILQVTLREISQVMKASDGVIQLKIPSGEEEARP